VTGSTEYEQWLGLFGRRDFKEVLGTFTVNYMPMIRLDRGEASKSSGTDTQNASNRRASHA
jgi:hypothetical protein